MHAAEPLFESLDYVYVPTADVDLAARRYLDELGAELVFKVRGMGTVVACVRVAKQGPAILLSGHLEGDVPILIYRVADYDAAIARLREAGIERIHQLEIPHGPCASFHVAGRAARRDLRAHAARARPRASTGASTKLGRDGKRAA